MQSVIFLFLSFLVAPVYAVPTMLEDCGTVQATGILSGPKHGSMMKVIPVCPSDIAENGWICLDPDAETMSIEESRRVYEQALRSFETGTGFRLVIDNGTFTSACGSGFPTVWDLRTP